MAAYTVRRTKQQPGLNGQWDSPVWAAADTGAVSNFRPEGSGHRPKVSFRMLYDARHVYGLFRAEDRYVRSVQTDFNGSVCTDSCVEFFVKPKADKGYLNFEFNAGGTLLVSCVVDPARKPTGGFADYAPLRKEEGAQVGIFHSLPAVVEPEIQEPTTWFIEFRIPIALLEKYVGAIGDPAGQRWTANFYKCGDKTSHPHWAAWSPVDQLNFHLPRCFGALEFEPA